MRRITAPCDLPRLVPKLRKRRVHRSGLLRVEKRPQRLRALRPRAIFPDISAKENEGSATLLPEISAKEIGF